METGIFDVTMNCEVSLIQITGMQSKDHKKEGEVGWGSNVCQGSIGPGTLSQEEREAQPL